MEIKSTIQDGGLLKGIAYASENVKKKASYNVREVSFSVEKRVKNEMPVNTGRARASWGHWTPASIIKYEMSGKSGKLKKVRADIWQGNIASKNDAHWVIKDDGLTIEQGSNVDYIINLNQGTSMQAPAAFIDKAAEAGAIELEKKLYDTIGDLL